MTDPKMEDAWEETLRAHEEACRAARLYSEAVQRYQLVLIRLQCSDRLSDKDAVARFNRQLEAAKDRAWKDAK